MGDVGPIKLIDFLKNVFKTLQIKKTNKITSVSSSNSSREEDVNIEWTVVEHFSSVENNTSLNILPDDLPNDLLIEIYIKLVEEYISPYLKIITLKRDRFVKIKQFSIDNKITLGLNLNTILMPLQKRIENFVTTFVATNDFFTGLHLSDTQKGILQNSNLFNYVIKTICDKYTNASGIVSTTFYTFLQNIIPLINNVGRMKDVHKDIFKTIAIYLYTENKTYRVELNFNSENKCRIRFANNTNTELIDLLYDHNTINAQNQILTTFMTNMNADSPDIGNIEFPHLVYWVNRKCIFYPHDVNNDIKKELYTLLNRNFVPETYKTFVNVNSSTGKLNEETINGINRMLSTPQNGGSKKEYGKCTKYELLEKAKKRNITSVKQSMKKQEIIDCLRKKNSKNTLSNRTKK